MLRRHAKTTYSVVAVVALVVVILFVASYATWSRMDRGGVPGDKDLRIRYVSAYGKDSGKGNVVAVQPYTLASDYASILRLANKLDAYLYEARKRGWLNRKTVVVFPEYIGAWLVVGGREKRGVYTSPTVDGAMKLMAASNPISFARAYVAARGPDRAKEALFRMKGKWMAGWYDAIFSNLAKRYGVTIVAGSIILPAQNGGPLRNVSAVYGPDAKPLGMVTKAFPTREEKTFIAPGKVEDLPVFDTPAGKLGVLVCADAWFPEAYEVLKRKGASIVVVPSYGMGSDEVLKRKWRGYSGWPNPSDVSAGDPGNITEWQAFMKYSLPGRLPESGIPTGVVVCLRGRLWDLGSHGTTVVVKNGKVKVAPSVDGAAIVNVWL